MAFPTTPILDDFNRANENPLSQSGAWTTMGEQNPLIVETNLVNGGPVGGEGTSYRDVNLGDSEAYLTLPTILGAGQSMFFGLRFKDNGGASPIRLSRMDGYRLALIANTNYHVLREDNGSTTLLVNNAAWAGGNLASGDSAGFRAIGSLLEVWVKRGAGAWTLENAVPDSTHTTGALVLNMKNDGTKPRGDDFGGGAVLAQVLRPDADTTTTGWTATPLWSKVEEAAADGTIVTATAS